jgi:hypothetical protein
MSQSEARAWWADVEHLRERLDGAAHPSLVAIGSDDHAPAPAARPARRTVQITGRGAPAPAVTPRHLVEVPRPLSSAPARRRSAPRVAERAAHRPDRIAMWAVLLGLALVLVAVTSANAATSLGDRTLHVPMKGRDVRVLQQELVDLGLLSTSPTAYYGRLTRSAVRDFQRSRCLTADGIAGPATVAALRNGAPRCARRGAGARLRSRVVTWYGPGLFGRRTACGKRLTRRLVGVAHRTLPCGTRIRFERDGHIVEARVVDRGPHAAGVQYDLTWATARALGVLGAGRVAVRASR